MSKLVFVKEQGVLEKCCAILPENEKSYKRLSAEILVEVGIGQTIGINDQDNFQINRQNPQQARA